MTETTLRREEILLLARHAGLDLPARFHDELVDAYAHIRRLAARLPQGRPRGDEPAHVFVPTTFMPR
jgi:hypothetical protein